VKRPIAAITGLGTYVPERVLTNADFERMLDTSDTWIRERTGIIERHIAGAQETTALMATEAGRRALAEAGSAASDLDAIVLATATPDRLLPSVACEVQATLGASRAFALDVDAACPGWVYGLVVAEGLLAAGTAAKILVIGTEKLSAITDYSDRSTAVLFGDAAGAVVLEKSDGSRGVLSAVLGSDGTLMELLWRPAGGTIFPPGHEGFNQHDYYIRMAGREVFKNAVRSMAAAAADALARAGLTADQVDLLVPHQANIRIIEATASHAKIPMDRVYVNVDRYGNTSSASIPLALDEARREGTLRPGMHVLLVTFGAGFTWGAAVLKW
jgi:3-oxoacyl-[acyl-carrier-protein] synthase-3